MSARAEPMTACRGQDVQISLASGEVTVRNDESMIISGDGTFVCHLQRTGFIAEMLYPAGPGTVSGTWSIAGRVMTLTISGAQHEHLANRISSSVIVAFSEDEISLRSHGNTSSFRRTAGL